MDPYRCRWEAEQGFDPIKNKLGEEQVHRLDGRHAGKHAPPHVGAVVLVGMVQPLLFAHAGALDV